MELQVLFQDIKAECLPTYWGTKVSSHMKMLQPKKKVRKNHYKIFNLKDNKDTKKKKPTSYQDKTLSTANVGQKLSKVTT